MVFLQILLVLACILLMFFILVQPARGEGLASAFGGGGSETFFGTKAHQHMSRFTIGLSLAVLILALLINYWGKGRGPAEDKTRAPNTPAPTEGPQPPK